MSRWEAASVSSWAAAVKRCPGYFSRPNAFVEAIAVLKRANQLITGCSLTLTQLMSLLVAFEGGAAGSGRLLQVQTGEGKTVIIAMLAIIKALQGRTVDVITSSPVEAERCARDQKPLYRMFGISVADNVDRSPYVKGTKRCYRSNVVYGDIAQFQFDLLRHEYGLLRTRGDRALDQMIADEVDSLLIDDSTKIAKLSSPLAGIDRLDVVFVHLYTRVQEFLTHVHTIGDRQYFFYGKVLGVDNGGVRVAQAVGTAIQEVMIPESALLAYTKDVHEYAQPIEGEMQDFLETWLRRYFDEQRPLWRLPRNFDAFVDRQASKWIRNAVVAAFEFHDKAHYVVHESRV